MGGAAITWYMSTGTESVPAHPGGRAEDRGGGLASLMATAVRAECALWWVGVRVRLAVLAGVSPVAPPLPLAAAMATITTTATTASVPPMPARRRMRRRRRAAARSSRRL